MRKGTKVCVCLALGEKTKRILSNKLRKEQTAKMLPTQNTDYAIKLAKNNRSPIYVLFLNLSLSHFLTPSLPLSLYDCLSLIMLNLQYSLRIPRPLQLKDVGGGGAGGGAA